ncbi:MFS transporter [Nocardia pseudobrasiliensis]|uniref:Putative MFS family arabinose efflux permease n=1 Tax=Nocardia pseudobrasiliensis TaxID=45979 RepID=A0A370IEJ3_9NOCA|nr:MFS transporter [Nocardia pseudobrasiliensis]RDI69152.1 putative MFS family arabinose efflux permease [Nocardia pseudobrasiliensis]
MATLTPAHTLAPDRVPPGRIWFAAWPVLVVFVLSNAATPLYPLWRERLGFSAGTLTVIFAGYIVGLIAALLVAGVLSDRIGRRPVLLPGLMLALVACALFATANSVVVLGIARVLTGVAVGATVSAGMAAVADVAGPGRKGLAALAASTAMVFGAGTGPLLAGVLSEVVAGPTVVVFVVEAVLLVSAGVVVMRLPLTAPKVRTAGLVRIPTVPRANRRDLLLGVAVFAPGITSTSFVLSLGPSLLVGLLGTGNRIVAGAMAFAMFAAATGAQFAARPWPVRRVLLAGACAVVAAMAALAVALSAHSVIALVVAAVLAGAGQGLGQFGGLTLLFTRVPDARRAEANAALNIGGYVPAAVLPVTAGYLGDAVGLGWGAGAFAAVLGHSPCSEPVWWAAGLGWIGDRVRRIGYSCWSPRSDIHVLDGGETLWI